MKSKINLIIDLLMLVFFAVTGYSAFDGHMRGVHNFAGSVLIVLIAIHIVLHYKILIGMIKNIIN